MRTLLAAALIFSASAASSAQAANFTLYPGFLDRDAFVEMVTDKGLILEIVLRCERKGNKVRAGIITYSKHEGLFCDSKLRCTRDAGRAADNTCGY
ncbi:hypothetical protein [Ahrensia sp. R2A130]|uniref:hypothetical protein n=1 Tax=Ahrensia sp. R2A130 TaxID=744979 RepID=UPI0001E08428|nr:hypothetical protein [Ahrensia sp. R2A130]EFL88067.1 putative DNA repair protein RecO [Ahrensia sp. R2A130]